MADSEVLQGEAKSVQSNTVTVLVETPVIITEEANESDGKSRTSSIAWSSSPSLNQRSAEKFRSLKRRSSVENFGQFGFLVPALSLVPHADGADALTQQFGDLQGSHRELKLASAHIDDALKGRGSYGKARSYFKPRLAQRCFDILDNPWFRYLIIWNSLLHSFLIFFEPPTIQVSRVHPFVYVLNMSCIMLFMFDLVVHIIFLTWPVFWSRRTEGGWWNGVEFVLVCCFTADFVLLVISRFLGKYIPPIFRSFRLALILCKVKNIQHIFNVLMTIGFKLSKLFFIILVFVLMCACIGVHILMDAYQCNGPLDNSSSTTFHHGKRVPCYVRSEEKVYHGAFDDVAYGMLRLFVLLSTENFPEVMLPALRVESAYFVYFGLFVFVGVFFLTAILLAIVVDSYWVYSKKHVKKERSRERAELAKAWNLLDPLGRGTLSLDDEKFTLLFHLLKPKNSEAENLVLIEMLDANGDGEVDSFEWTTMLSKVLSLEFEDDDDLLLLDETPGLSKWMISIRESAKSLSESILFSRFILFLIIVHCILFAFKWKGQNQQIEFIVQVFRGVIVTTFLFEGGTRLVALGRRILQPHEIVDLFLVVLAFCSNFVWYTNYPEFFWFRDYATTISSLAVFCRLPFNNSQLNQAVSIFFRIAPVMVDLLCLLGIILFLLASVGMELFHGASETSEGHMYLPACGLGFQTFWCACLILFQMVTTSNWHEIMNSVMEATKSKWTSLYFVAAYIVVNMVIMKFQ
ncbi:two pore calcium channel protein 1A-like [Stylophora pistillata]|uniref:two pore calcium channel protein 1A-like n=1 Tax=Stylophora pistillata TaxID=50429 RepID=UPI000C047505|nr:two pore calcium channel protein 1A-like [Stylophora pistillata]